MQALALTRRTHATVEVARAQLTQLYRLLSDASRDVTNRAPPALPSPASASICEKLHPAPPADLQIDVSICGSPPQLHCSAFVMRPASGANGPTDDSTAVVESRHVALDQHELVARVDEVGEAAALCHALLAKAAAAAELLEVDGERQVAMESTRASAPSQAASALYSDV